MPAIRLSDRRRELYTTSSGTRAYAIHRVGVGCPWEPDPDYALFFTSLDDAKEATGKVPCNTCIGR